MLIRFRQDRVRVTDPPFNADPTGARSSAQAFNDAAEAAVDIEIPPGTYRLPFHRTHSPRPGLNVHTSVVIPESGRTFWGYGPATTLVVELPEPVNYDGMLDYRHHNSLHTFWCDWDTSHHTFRDFRVVGQGKANLTPAAHLFNTQPAVIESAFPHPDFGLRGATDITVERVIFERLLGFPAHARAGGDRWHVHRCTMIDCHNGLNINGDDGDYAWNSVLRSEGFELTGSGLLVDNNRFSDAILTAIAYGGHTGPPLRGNRSYGARITNTIVRGAWRHGVELTTNVSDVLLAHSHLERIHHHGVQVGGDSDRYPDNGPRNVRLYDNDVVDWGNESENCAFYLADVQGARLLRNTARHGEFEGFNPMHGLVVRGGSEVEVIENDLAGTFAALAAVGDVNGLEEARNTLRGRRLIEPGVRRRGLPRQ